MRVLLSLLLFLLFSVGAGAEEENLKVLQSELDGIYSDAEQVFNETMARGRLVEEDFRIAQEIQNKAFQTIDNLVFRLEAMREQFFATRREAVLLVRYKSEFEEKLRQMRSASESVTPIVRETCREISEWKNKSLVGGKREQLLEHSRAAIVMVVNKLKKMQELLDDSSKKLGEMTSLMNRSVQLMDVFEELVEKVNALVAPEQKAKGIWLEQQEELKIIPLRERTLGSLGDKSKDVFARIKRLSPADKVLLRAEKEVKLVAAYHSSVLELEQRLLKLSQQIEQGTFRFDAKAKAFRKTGLELITPYQSGLVDTLKSAVLSAEAQFVEASLLKQPVLDDLEKLRACVGRIEKESDLSIVPSVVGLSVEESVGAIKKSRLRPMQKGGEPAASKEQSGKVYEQEPEAGEKVFPGTIVNFRAYTDYVPIVPDLTGMGAKEVEEVLGQRGLHGVGREGEAATETTQEGVVYSQFPRAFTSVKSGGAVNYVYYGKAYTPETEEEFSSTTFYVVCRLYVPRLKPGAPRKADLTINDVNFVAREAPYVIAVQEEALDRYSLTFFEPNKAMAAFVQIIGREVDTGLKSQYDGALLFEVEGVYHSFDAVKEQVGILVDLSSQDPLSFIEITRGDGLFKGVSLHDNIQLSWTGGPLVDGWSNSMKAGSFSLFWQLL